MNQTQGIGIRLRQRMTTAQRQDYQLAQQLLETAPPQFFGNGEPARAIDLQLGLVAPGTPMAFCDLDGALRKDHLVQLLETLGSRDSKGKLWRRVDRCYKEHGFLSNGEHMFYHARDLCTHHDLEELQSVAREQHKFFPGVLDMLLMFNEVGVGTLAVTNSFQQFNEPAFAKDGFKTPIVSNKIRFGSDGGFLGVEFVHDAEHLVRKDQVVQYVQDKGYPAAAAIGDSAADFPMAKQVIEAGGFAITVGAKGKLTSMCQGHFHPEDYIVINNAQRGDFRKQLGKIRERLQITCERIMAAAARRRWEN